MDWVNELCDLYEKNKSKAGKMDYKEIKTKNGMEKVPLVLLPPFHTTVAAQITVTINEKGDFLDAKLVESEDKTTIIPVTEKSGSRTSKEYPHPFCDNVKHLAGDYKEYCRPGTKKPEEAFELYMEALEKWHLSEFTHKKVDALYSYITKKKLIHDLVKVGILKLGEDGKLAKNEKIQGIEQDKLLVRFCILEELDLQEDILCDTTGKFYSECWLDRSLQDSYIQYNRSLMKEKDICYLTGNLEQPSYLHSKKIRNEGDGSKLISSNDKNYYTFRGRFENKEQAFSIGYETSQNVHNALKWIIRRQGKNVDTLCLVTWESDLQPMPGWDLDTDSICAEEQEGWGDEDTDTIEETPKWNGDQSAANRFNKALFGYGKNLSNMSRMVLIALDAATTGRLAVVEYKNLESTRYLENIDYWHSECDWIHLKYQDNHAYHFRGMVGVKDIAEILYGTEQNGALTLGNKGNTYSRVCKRLIPCIWDRRNVPDDMVSIAVSRASSPVSYEKRYNWERTLTLACSLVKKQRHQQNPEEVWTLAVDRKSPKGHKRDYLYGRLLAVADWVESRTYDKKDREANRQTNARRYMSMFSQRPYETWKVIEESLGPYFQKLKYKEDDEYNVLLNEIYEMYLNDDYEDNSKLEGLYLLGFHNQSYELRHGKPDEAENIVKPEE